MKKYNPVKPQDVMKALPTQAPLPEDDATDAELLAAATVDMDPAPARDLVVAAPEVLVVKSRGVIEQHPIGVTPAEGYESGDLVVRDIGPPVAGASSASPSIVLDVVANTQRNIDINMARASTQAPAKGLDVERSLQQVREWLAPKSAMTLSNIWHKSRMTLSLPTTTQYNTDDLSEINAAVQSFLADDDFLCRCIRWAARCHRTWGANTLGCLVICEAYNRAVSAVIDAVSSEE